MTTEARCSRVCFGLNPCPASAIVTRLSDTFVFSNSGTIFLLCPMDTGSSLLLRGSGGAGASSAVAFVTVETSGSSFASNVT